MQYFLTLSYPIEFYSLYFGIYYNSYIQGRIKLQQVRFTNKLLGPDGDNLRKNDMKYEIIWMYYQLLQKHVKKKFRYNLYTILYNRIMMIYESVVLNSASIGNSRNLLSPSAATFINDF